MTKVGIIGYSEGNGHPFSFSAIVNGYNRAYFHLNPIKPINDYLSVQAEDSFGVGDLKVTHVWTESKELSTAIALYATIPNVVDHYLNMIDEVDAVLVLRDDKHKVIAENFLQRGKFVFIDKPLAVTQSELDFFKPYLESGRLMSCSGLRFFPKLTILSKKPDLGNFKFAYCTTPVSWLNYGIHSLEGLLPILSSPFDYVRFLGEGANQIFKVVLQSGAYIMINVSDNYSGGIRSHVYFQEVPPIEIVYNDNFACFKQTLVVFHEQLKSGSPVIRVKEIIALMQVLMAGEESRSKNGEKISIHA